MNASAHSGHGSRGTLYASPAEAMQAPPEEFLYLACLHEGTGVEAPDFIAVVDAEGGRIVHETPMPNVGDELHHFGGNRCSSACHGPDRSHLIVPGFRSSRIHVVNVADDPRAPRIEKVIEAEELVAKTGYTRPHTVHCMPGENVVISMLGDADGNGSGGFAVLDAHSFELKGRWENGGERPPLNYDFWYQPRKNVLISSQFGEPNAHEPGFDLAHGQGGRTGQRPPLLDLPHRTSPKLTGQLGLGGLLGKPSDAGRELNGGPQMLQLSYDGRRLYVTNSLYSTWDNQFYPELRSWLLRVNCFPEGGMEVDRDFFVAFDDRPDGPARAHEVRLQGGDCTTEIFQ